MLVPLATALAVLVYQSSFCVVYTASNKGHLTLQYLSIFEVSGTFAEYEGSTVGIEFNSFSNSLSITTLKGKPLLVASEAIGPYRWFVVDTNTFLQVNVNHNGKQMYKDCALDYTIDEDNFLATWKKYLNSVEQFAQSCDMEDRNVQKILQASLNTLMEKPEINLLQEAVMALGTDIGITGSDYPSILPLYLVALNLHKVWIDSQFLAGHSNVSESESMRYQKVQDDSDCLDECPPCPDDLCLGMCGYSCSCWKWVCGDCCYHLGCYGHDVCCRENFIQTKCLFPFSFKCEETYEC